ncbi:hypothetical protein D1155_01060 [Anaerotruncus sp. 80]|uniref:Alpha-L-glutamate ligase-related protein ATP-grasp domain-containing protein n=1 Tax=Anaerotruncus colihominis TaxID=169435 RepID=A0A845QEY9_9FIRM|nr:MULTISPECIES: sugar-transfer associated ATP-grasp domain-containing protein [Anaerotruncus]NBH60262.1 hypothetical protein [Anaerotruncus colihominis]NCF00916.1 hypothetical protein [Anaerotruncus sp. 80]
MFSFFRKKADSSKSADKALKKQKRKEENILSVMSKTGWSREKTVAQIEDARQRLGITYKDYNRYEFYKIPINEQESEYQRKEAQRKRKAEKNEKFLHTVMENTGWSYEVAKEKMEESKAKCGAEYKDYVAYRFWETDEETQKTYFTKGDANALRKKYNTNKENVACFRNKNEFNEVFGDCLGRVWTYNKDVSLEEFTEKFKNEKKVIYKPLSASCGSGVQVFDISEDSVETSYDRIKTLPVGIVEGYLIQHPDMSRFSKRAVNTLRVVSVFKDDEVHILYAAFRMAGGDAVVDNFHNGGVLALIDLESGKVMTDAIDLSGKIYETHPATGEIIKGFQVPYWDEVKALIDKAGRIVEGVGYVGWDIAVTESGPVLIEGNTSPAPNVLQLPFYLQEHRGMHHVVERYL